MAHVVAVEHVGELGALHELCFDRDGDGRFARAREAGEPDGGAALAEHGFALGAADLAAVPGDVGRLLLCHAPSAKPARVATSASARARCDPARPPSPGPRRPHPTATRLVVSRGEPAVTHASPARSGPRRPHPVAAFLVVSRGEPAVTRATPARTGPRRPH